MTPIEALQLALSKEVNAIELYDRLSNEHTQLRELFTYLMNEEEKHKKNIEEKIYELTR